MNWWLFAYFVLCVILAYALADNARDSGFTVLMVGALSLLLFLTGCGGSDDPQDDGCVSMCSPCELACKGNQ